MKIFTRFRKPATPQTTVASNGHSYPLTFKDFTEDDLAPIYQACPSQKLGENAIVIKNQKYVDSLYMILKGSLLLSISSKIMNNTVQFQEGTLFGLIPQKNNEDMLYSIVSKNKSTIIEINRATFLNLQEHLKIKLLLNTNKTLINILNQSIGNLSNLSKKNQGLASYIHNNENKKKEIVSSELIQKVITKIPKLPTYTTDLMTSLLNENTPIQHITEIIEKDPSLAGIILKNVNSVYYGLQRKISSIQHAIAYLGFSNIYDIILNDSIRNVLPNNEEFREIQNHSTIISIMSREISSASKKPKRVNPATIGVLHDIGKIVVLLLKRKHPDLYGICENIEDSLVGAKLLENWELPGCIFEVIEKQHLPEFCAPEDLKEEYIDDITILYLAHVYYDMLTEQSTVSTTYVDEYLSMLDIPQNNHLHFYKEMIIPALLKNKRRLPEAIRDLLTHKLSSKQSV